MSVKKSVKDVAELACLDIRSDEESQFQNNFDQVMSYFSELENVNTDGIEPMVTPHEFTSKLRADEVRPDLSVDELLKNAPDVKDGLFKVPPVV